MYSWIHRSGADTWLESRTSVENKGTAQATLACKGGAREGAGEKRDMNQESTGPWKKPKEYEVSHQLGCF